MIETLAMSLPSEVTKAIIDIAVVLGELSFFLMITMCCHLLLLQVDYCIHLLSPY